MLERKDDGVKPLDVDGEREQDRGGPGRVDGAEDENDAAIEQFLAVPLGDRGQPEAEEGEEQKERVRQRQRGQQLQEGVLQAHK